MARKPKKTLRQNSRLREARPEVKKKFGGAQVRHKRHAEPATEWAKVPEDAEYVTAGHQAYMIYQDGTFWKVKRYKGGRLPKPLSTSWTSFQICENALINYLRSTDKWGYAKYPGHEPRKRLYVKS